MIQLGILGSTRGTNMLSIIEAIESKKLDAKINVVVSNQEDTGILLRAREHSLPAIFISKENLLREVYDQKLSDIFLHHHVDLIVLIGYMRILSKNFIDTWQNKIINVHPSLLPKYAGGMDKAVHQAVLDAHEKETGCTVHYVTEAVDSGPIIIQKKCAVFSNDTVETLKARVQSLEGTALIQAIQKIGKKDER